MYLINDYPRFESTVIAMFIITIIINTFVNINLYMLINRVKFTKLTIYLAQNNYNFGCMCVIVLIIMFSAKRHP